MRMRYDVYKSDYDPGPPTLSSRSAGKTAATGFPRPRRKSCFPRDAGRRAMSSMKRRSHRGQRNDEVSSYRQPPAELAPNPPSTRSSQKQRRAIAEGPTPTLHFAQSSPLTFQLVWLWSNTARQPPCRKLAQRPPFASLITSSETRYRRAAGGLAEDHGAAYSGTGRLPRHASRTRSGVHPARSRRSLSTYNSSQWTRFLRAVFSRSSRSTALQ
jgi:hypothetical protein